MTAPPTVLEVRDLTISVAVAGGDRANVVEGVSLRIGEGESVGLVGESGSGKTMTSLAVMGLLPPAARVESGEILLDGEDLLRKSPRELGRIRGKRVAMVLQDSLTALDPSFTVLSQLTEPLRMHRGLRGDALDQAVVEALDRVQLPSSRERLRQYPHQLSGGRPRRST
jgi:ABC-type microcin C transport system duplicated ATPase subunit YejF